MKKLLQKLTGKPGAAKDSKTAEADKNMLDNMTNKEVDKQLEDTFPASDPPGNY